MRIRACYPRRRRSARAIVAVMRALSIICILFAPALASAGEPPATPTTPATPPALAVPAGEHLVLTARARGAQIYTCAPDPKDATQLVWTLKAPEAQLVDEHNRPLGKHYAGPTWEANDGSKIVGEVVARAAQPGTIPWLLLRAKAQGNGVLAGVTSIQRLDTAGGAAPASGCDAAHRGAELRVPYSASYHFFSK